jgi:hypothetical protein
MVLDEFLRKKQNAAEVMSLSFLAGVELSMEHATYGIGVDAGRFNGRR